ncbi:hypothetical protein CBS101457_000234 [Exobasidium rhododendri]|nr:hypothetical protein CBS101457_000234 [Exobasidium rhododendri]
MLTIAWLLCLISAAPTPTPSPMDGDRAGPKLGKVKTRGKTRQPDRSTLHAIQEDYLQETHQHPGFDAGFYSSRAVRPSTSGATSSRRGDRESRSRSANLYQNTSLDIQE